MDTKVIIVVYQHLFVQICIFRQDTIGYKRYNLKISVGNQHLFKEKFNYRLEVSNTVIVKDARV